MSKKILSIGLASLIAIFIGGCGGAPSEVSATSETEKSEGTTEVVEQGKTKTVSCNGLNIEVDASWDVRDDGDEKTISTENDGSISVSWREHAVDVASAEKVYASFAEGLTYSGVTVGNSPEKFAIGEAVAYRVEGGCVIDGVTYKGYYELVLCDDKGYYSVMSLAPEKSDEVTKGEIKSALDSISLDQNVASGTASDS